MVNLCNGETKDFAELWKFIHLKVWTHFSIRQMKLFWINFCTQTCSNDHLCKTTTCLRQLILSPPKQMSVQSLRCKTTTCLTEPATTFLFPKWKKAFLKQPLKALSSGETENKHQEQCIKNKRFSDYIYSFAALNCKVFLMSTKAGQFIIIV